MQRISWRKRPYIIIIGVYINLATAIVTIIMFLVMVSLHEFGHFIVAKLLNFKILEYSIGFGPKLFSRRPGKNGETAYSLRAIPLGGYCKFDGEDESSEDPRAFGNQAVWKRILVVAAGGVFNVILGFVIFLVMLPSLSPMLTNRVESVVPHSYIEDSGIMPGDEIIALNGKSVDFYSDITLYREDMSPNEENTVTIKRGKEKIDVPVMLTEQKTSIAYFEDHIEYTSEINGFPEVQRIEYSDDMPRNDEKIGTEESSAQYIIGFSPASEEITAGNIWGYAWSETKFVVKLVYKSLWDLVTGKVGMEQMSGPVGIVNEVNNAVHQENDSWLYVLNLTALLTINLGVFNLLPLPALDGGRLLFMLIELVRRKPIPPEKEGMVHAIGMLLLFALIIFISFQDIMKLISG